MSEATHSDLCRDICHAHYMRSLGMQRSKQPQDTPHRMHTLAGHLHPKNTCHGRCTVSVHFPDIPRSNSGQGSLESIYMLRENSRTRHADSYMVAGSWVNLAGSSCPIETCPPGCKISGTHVLRLRGCWGRSRQICLARCCKGMPAQVCYTGYSGNLHQVLVYTLGSWC